MNNVPNQENTEKKKPHAKSAQNADLLAVPSISDADALHLADTAETLTDMFSFSESEDAAPEAVLDIPSFSGLDMLNVSAAAQMIDDLEEDTFQSDALPEVPVPEQEQFGKTEIPAIPSFADTQAMEAKATAIEIPLFEDMPDEKLPEIPSFFFDQNETSAKETGTENLLDISAFLSFDSNPQQEEPTLTAPEKPEDDAIFQGDLSEAAQDILPRVPSVSDLDILDMSAIPQTAKEENLLDDETNAEFLTEIPSVTDIDTEWEKSEIQENAELSTKEESSAVEEEEALTIAELPLSLKALHDLQKIDIQMAQELLDASKEELEAIPDIDSKTLREILHVRKLQQQKNAQTTRQQPVSEKSEKWLDAFLHELESIGVSEKRQIHLKAYLRAIQPEQTEKAAYYAAWYQETHVQLQLDKYISSLLRKRQMSGLSTEMIQESLPASLDKQILSNMLQEMLAADRLIESRDKFYTLKYPHVLEFLSDNTSEKEQHIEVLRKRMDGFSSDEISQEMKTSREQILKAQNKMLRLVQKLCLINRTSVYEERFRPLFEKYELTKKIFMILTKESEQVFYYLSMVAFPGSKQPEEIPDDMGVPGWVRENWLEYLKQNP